MKLPKLDDKRKKALAIGAGAIVVIIALIARSRGAVGVDPATQPTFGVAVPDNAANAGYPAGGFDSGQYLGGGGAAGAGALSVDVPGLSDAISGISALETAVYGQSDALSAQGSQISDLGQTALDQAAQLNGLAAAFYAREAAPIVPAASPAAARPVAKAAKKPAPKPKAKPKPAAKAKPKPRTPSAKAPPAIGNGPNVFTQTSGTRAGIKYAVIVKNGKKYRRYANGDTVYVGPASS